VFQGGGAKGVAYVGAVRAVAEHRCWFRAVAGSSAGAITAALIAAGLTPDEMELYSAEGLSSLRKARWWHHVDAVLGADRPLYDTAALRCWLEKLLRAQITRLLGFRTDAETDVTFAELFAATGIDLFVVLLDADGGSPVVLNHVNSPETQVSWAVVASSAIPAALPKQRLVMAGDAGYWRQSRMFDGGAWANYPRFVFADTSFRAFHRLDAVPGTVRTVGFVLSVASEDPALVFDQPGKFVGETEVRFRLPKPTPGVGQWRRYCAGLGIGWAFGAMLHLLFMGHPLYTWQGATLSTLVAVILLTLGRKSIFSALLDFLGFITLSRLQRGILLGAVALCFVLSLWSLHELQGVFAISPLGEDSTLGGLWTVITFFLMFALPAAVTVVAALLIMIFRFQMFLLFDAVSVLGASLGAAVKVPVCGAGPGDHLVVVPVMGLPTLPTVTTTDFNLSSEQRSAVIANAHEATRQRVGEILEVEPGQSSSPDRPDRSPAVHPGSAELNPPEKPGSGLWTAAIFCWIAAFGSGFFSYALWTNLRAGVGAQSVFDLMSIVTVCLVAGGAVLAFLGRRRSYALRSATTQNESANKQHRPS
jgi:hypothetical protein